MDAPPAIEVDTDEVSTVGKWAGWTAMALFSTAFLFVAFWSLLSLFWLPLFAIPAAYYYFRAAPAGAGVLKEQEQEQVHEQESQPDATPALPPELIIVEIDEPDEVTAKYGQSAEDSLARQIKEAADRHDWDRIAQLTAATRSVV